MKRISCLAIPVVMLCLAALASSQRLATFRVTDAHSVPRRADLGLRKYIDWRVTFTITNTTKNGLKVFGSDAGNGSVDPIRYMLDYNQRTNRWEYPNPNNKPTPWKKESGTQKHVVVLKTGESLTVTREFSREQECGRRVMVTAQIASVKSRKSHELRSDEYQIPCVN